MLLLWNSRTSRKSCERKIKDSKELKINVGQYGESMRVQGAAGGKRVVGLETVVGKRMEIKRKEINEATSKKEKKGLGNNVGDGGSESSSNIQDIERVGEEGSEQKKEAKVTHGKGRSGKKDQMVKGFKGK